MFSVSVRCETRAVNTNTINADTVKAPIHLAVVRVCACPATVVNMMDENSMPPSITSTTGFVGECNTGSVSSSTEQFIICCKVCGSLNGLRRCSRCKSVYYCSQVHQQVDWRVHKIECKKFATNLVTSEYFNLEEKKNVLSDVSYFFFILLLSDVFCDVNCFVPID